jgi:hypothetical protein
MRFFASWWERFPVREAATSLVVVLAVLGAAGHFGGLLKVLAGPAGWTWG